MEGAGDNFGAPEITRDELQFNVNDERTKLGDGSFGHVWKVSFCPCVLLSAWQKGLFSSCPIFSVLRLPAQVLEGSRCLAIPQNGALLAIACALRYGGRFNSGQNEKKKAPRKEKKKKKKNSRVFRRENVAGSLWPSKFPTRS